MIFQCDDLDRALQHPELMPDARAHAETCRRCSEQLAMWYEISRLAPELHREWESPELWGRIHAELTPTLERRRPRLVWGWTLATAAALTLAVALLITGPHRHASSASALLTEDTLREVQQAEAAYARSIAKLSAAAGASLDQSPSPAAAAYREKLLVLDSAIAEYKSTIETNRYNTYLQSQLASLYREKQKTLEEWLKNANHN